MPPSAAAGGKPAGDGAGFLVRGSPGSNRQLPALPVDLCVATVKRHPASGGIGEETHMSWIRTHRVISFFALSYLFSWWAMILYWLGAWPQPTFVPAGPL